MFKTYPTFAAGTWLCAWTRTAAWVSLSGASALSTPATTPSSSPLQVTTSLMLMAISSDFSLMLSLISFNSEVEANPALWLTAVSQYKV